MPTPHSAQVAGKARAVEANSVATWSGVSAGLTASTSAAVPLTTGVAMEVPISPA
jgi:hypothetical protein